MSPQVDCAYPIAGNSSNAKNAPRAKRTRVCRWAIIILLDRWIVLIVTSEIRRLCELVKWAGELVAELTQLCGSNRPSRQEPAASRSRLGNEKPLLSRTR